MNLTSHFGSGCQKGSTVRFDDHIWPILSLEGNATITKLSPKKLELKGSVTYTLFGAKHTKEFTLSVKLKSEGGDVQAVFGSDTIRDKEAVCYVKGDRFCADVDVEKDERKDVVVRIWADGARTKAEVRYGVFGRIVTLYPS